MKVLWLCNIMLPVIAKALGREVSNKEGWLSGLVSVLLERRQENNITLAVAFPTDKELDGCKGETGSLFYYGFYENTHAPEMYDIGLEERLAKILEDFKPDVIHCFGTEFPHTLAMAKVAKEAEKVLIGLQGLCTRCADVYMADLPRKVQQKVTFRDFLRKDSLRKQQDKFKKRGVHEREALRMVKNITGRTDWDKENALSWNPEANYYSMNETLRSDFYEGGWCKENAVPHRILLSQGDYPLKGLHYVLLAMPLILEKYPDAELWVAGNPIVREKTLKGRLKVSAYGQYIQQLIEKENLQEKVHFLGKLDAEEMKKAYVESGLFLCSSAVENSPNSLGEAMLLGVPCVAAKVGGIPSLFADGEDGILYEGGHEKLAEAVIRMWEEPDRMETYTSNAKAHACKTHDKEANYKRLVEIYETIAACKEKE